MKAFRTALARLRALGMLVAIDDIGLGYSNFRVIVIAIFDGFAPAPAPHRMLRSSKRCCYSSCVAGLRSSGTCSCQDYS